MTHTCNVRSSWCCIQEISDDLGRHRSDAQVNNAPVTVLRGHEEGTTQWKHLQPGDLVKVCSFALKEPPPPRQLPPMVYLQWIASNGLPPTTKSLSQILTNGSCIQSALPQCICTSFSTRSIALQAGSLASLANWFACVCMRSMSPLTCRRTHDV